MASLFTTSKKGFSILIALGSIGVLMIIVVGMIQVFLTEMKLSRYQYDYILASEQAEGAFEYAMLKVTNHRDGFSDVMNEDSLDQILFSGSTARTEKTRVTYTINAQTGTYSKNLAPKEYLIFPLFVGEDILLDAPNPSKRPKFSSMSTIAINPKLVISGADDQISWSIVAFDKNTLKNISLAGTGKIDGLTRGKARNFSEECFASDATPLDCTNPSVYERIPYFFDKEGTINDFLTTHGEFGGVTPIQIKDPYMMVFNGDNIPHDITITADTPFALPELIVTTEAKKGSAVQRIRYTSDKSKYYDAIKYGIYNTP